MNKIFFRSRESTLSRAIGLLIIVGNHEALECDRSHWAAMIEHCNKNGALIRQKKTLYLRIKAPK